MALLDTLALVAAERTLSLAPAVTRLRRGGLDGVLVAVLGIVDVADAERLARLRAGAGACVALLLDADSWAPVGPKARAAAQREHDAVSTLLLGAG